MPCFSFCFLKNICVNLIIIQLIIKEETTKDMKILSAFSGIITLMRTQSTAKIAETSMPNTGTWFLFNFIKSLGAFPCSAKPYSIRLLEYTQLLYTDKAAVKTIIFNPLDISLLMCIVFLNIWSCKWFNVSKTITNGLVSSVISFQGKSTNKKIKKHIAYCYWSTHNCCIQIKLLLRQ